MWPLLFITIAAIAKALADTLAWHYDWFIAKFPKLKSDFWKINVVSKKVKRFASFPVDAWHITGTIMIAFLLAAGFVHKPYLHWAIDYSIGGVWFIIVFNTFYNKIFR